MRMPRYSSAVVVLFRLFFVYVYLVERGILIFVLLFKKLCLWRRKRRRRNKIQIYFLHLYFVFDSQEKKQQQTNKLERNKHQISKQWFKMLIHHHLLLHLTIRLFARFMLFSLSLFIYLFLVFFFY